MVICIAVVVFIALLICAIRYAIIHKKTLQFPESPEEETLSSEPHSANTYDEIEDADLSDHPTNMSTSTNCATVPLWGNDFKGSSMYIHPSVSQGHDRGLPDQSIFETSTTFLNMSTSVDSSRHLRCNGPLRMTELSGNGHDEALMYIHPVTSQDNDSDPSDQNVFETETTLSNLSSSISSVSPVTCNGPMRINHVISAAPDESLNCVQSVVPLNTPLSCNGQLRSIIESNGWG
ncbi:uncharacterized protein LOC121369236 [Gigantopelta aegis]|uniref:uncharacterized protein LOC121369236 n=1 Tax=Gigantopelta aegis TaxID=1735272 RepID=UPI001B88BC41|nr:uncharacterized protein LOC121369236 [Gigantopelta aegis]